MKDSFFFTLSKSINKKRKKIWYNIHESLSDWSLIEYDIKIQNHISPTILRLIITNIFILRCLQQSLNFFYIKQWKRRLFYDPLFDKNMGGWERRQKETFLLMVVLLFYFDPVANFFCHFFIFKTLLLGNLCVSFSRVLFLCRLQHYIYFLLLP